MDKEKELAEKLAIYLPSKPKNTLWEKKHATNSKEALLNRLSSFTLLKWNSKPPEISSLECSRHGWQIINTDLLQCSSCEVVLSGKLPKRFQLELYRKSSQSLAEQLIEAHHKMCPWRNNPSPDSFTDIESWEKEEIQQEFLQGLDFLSPMNDSLPPVVEDETGEISEALETLQELAAGKMLSSKLAQLAIQGWRIKNSVLESNEDLSSDTSEKTSVLQCRYCNRSVGLWETKNGHGDAKRLRLEEGLSLQKFDPILNHQVWCPWVKPSSKDGRLGWQVFFHKLCPKMNVVQTKINTDSELVKPRLREIRQWLQTH